MKWWLQLQLHHYHLVVVKQPPGNEKNGDGAKAEVVEKPAFFFAGVTLLASDASFDQANKFNHVVLFCPTSIIPRSGNPHCFEARVLASRSPSRLN